MVYVRWFGGLLLGNILMVATACAVCPREMAVDNALAGLSPYADVQAPFDCKSPKTSTARIICRHPLLIKLSELDARAQVFELENAMGQEITHKDYKDEAFEKNTLSQCKDETCICSAYSERIQLAFPEFSP